MTTATDHVVDCGDVRIAARDHGGHGPVVLLLHGGDRTMDDWDAILPSLHGQHRLVTMDLRGHGRSTRGEGAWQFDDALADVERVVDRLELDNPFVVGHSLGGMLATLYGGAHARCPGVVNVDGIGAAIPATLPGPDPAATRRDLEALIDEMAAVVYEDADSIQAVLGRAIRSLDTFAAIRRVRCPLLFVGAGPASGAADGPSDGFDGLMGAWRIGVETELERIAATNPNITWTSLPAGHMIPLDNPDDLADRLLEFLDRTSSPG
jgi:pimeloyl-ACP methyl ester carboxylesterase